jgi:hypothetical protein
MENEDLKNIKEQFLNKILQDEFSYFRNFIGF